MNIKYDEAVRIICGPDWSSPNKSQDDKDGGYGAAIMLAYMKGVPARINDLSRAIDVPPFLLEMSYKRLNLNGMFSAKSWILNNPSLIEIDSDSDLYTWCHIAGMSSGYIGKGMTREEYHQMRACQQEYENKRIAEKNTKVHK